ncbi:MAG: hypothetical protein AMXMBFR58_09210 [Phycisphaerae bacterium]
MSASNPNLVRILELLSDQVVGPLSPAEQQELDTLLAALPADQRAMVRSEQLRLERAAAETLAVMMQRDRAAPVPRSLRDRLLASGLAELGNDSTRSGPASPAASMPGGRPSFPVGGMIGWLAAAAAIIFAVFTYQNRPVPVPVPVVPTPAEQRTALINAPGTITASWSPGPDPAGAGVSGDVVWNAQQQKGFLRLKGLAENDPATFQYQLWIFDKTRQTDKPVLEQFPVDGGVFDIAAAQKDPATGDYIIPITAKLRVGDVAAFAITSEKPGGVVVTTRENLLSLAPVGG